MLVHNTLRKAARAQPNVRRRRDAITWQRHQRARRHRRRCETCFEIDFPAERETEKDGVKEGRQLDDVFAPLPPSFPLSHYVLLFHITAKQFEAPKGSPFPSLIFLPPPSSWPTWRVQYILRSYKLSKHGWLAGWLAAWRTPLEELTPAQLHPCSKVAGAAGIQKRVLISRNWEHHLAESRPKLQHCDRDSYGITPLHPGNNRLPPGI